jgi:hypothetical protein
LDVTIFVTQVTSVFCILSVVLSSVPLAYSSTRLLHNSALWYIVLHFRYKNIYCLLQYSISQPAPLWLDSYHSTVTSTVLLSLAWLLLRYNEVHCTSTIEFWHTFASGIQTLFRSHIFLRP